MLDIGRLARRLPPLAPEEANVRHTGRIEIELAVGQLLEHLLIGQNCQVEMERQSRSADVCWLLGSWAGGDGQAIIADGLGHRVRSCCVAVGCSACSVGVKADCSACLRSPFRWIKVKNRKHLRER
ncbi:hypothetical protein [Bradyrhizobium sp. UFLA05-112]